MRVGDVKLLVLPPHNNLWAFDEHAEVETQYMVQVESEVRDCGTYDEVQVVDIGEGSSYNGVSQFVDVAWLADLTEEDEYE